MVMTLQQAYEILRVNANSSEEEIKKSYKKLALKTHPDKNPNDPEAHKEFLKISEAYKRITDPDSFRDEDDGDDVDISEDEMNAMFFNMFNDLFPKMNGTNQNFHMEFTPQMFVMMEMMMGDDDMHGEFFEFGDEDDEEGEFSDGINDLMFAAMNGGEYKGKSKGVFMYEEDDDDDDNIPGMFSAEDLDEIAMMEYLLSGGNGSQKLNKKQQKELDKIMSHLGVEDMYKSSQTKRKPLRQAKNKSSKDIKANTRPVESVYNDSVKLPSNPHSGKTNYNSYNNSSNKTNKSNATKMNITDDEYDIEIQPNPIKSK
eukprot:gene19199-25049_t